MDNNKPCCKNCKNKKITNFAVGAPLYCEVKETRVNPDSLCPWHEGNKKKGN